MLAKRTSTWCTSRNLARWATASFGCWELQYVWSARAPLLRTLTVADVMLCELTVCAVSLWMGRADPRGAVSGGQQARARAEELRARLLNRGWLPRTKQAAA